MTLLEPIWIVLAIPLGLALWRWPPPTPWRRGLRIAATVLLVAALCRPGALLPRRGGLVIAVADRSASMPPDAADRQREVIDRLESSRGTEDRLAVVAFGAGAALERSPEGDRFTDFAADVDDRQSNLGEALETALSLAPAGGSSRLLVISDGRYTGADPLAAAGRATLAGVAVDVRLMERSRAGDVAIERVDAPSEASPGEGFLIHAWVRSAVAQEVRVELERGAQTLATGRRSLPAGRSRLTFRDRAGTAGVASYRLSVRGDGEDPTLENNTARFLLAVRGPRPLLVVTGGAEGGLAELLSAGGLDVRRVAPEAFRGTLDELGGFSAVVLENVPADHLGEAALEHLAAWVRAAGGGLMATGGRRSFGPGGYFRSPLDPVLPVSMELRQEHRKMALAMVVALDRSGSMAAPVAGGRTKMDLANLATVEVLDLLSPLDEFGVVAVDSQPHLAAPLRPVGNVAATRNMILRIDSGGGGIFVYEALQASAEQLLRARAGARHILLFADAADAENPGDYQRLLERCKSAGITVSVVGLGRPSDADAELLRDIARRGDGRAFFTERADELPRLFAQDTFVVSRSAFVAEETPVRFTAALATLTGQTPSPAPPVGGYNLTYLKPEADLAAVTADDYEAPWVAAWQVGLGRALAYTAEVDGVYAGPIAGWPGLGDLLTGLGRWTAGEGSELGGGMLLTQELEGGEVVVRLHLDPERASDPFVKPPAVSALHGLPGKPPASVEGALSWVDPDTLETRVPLSGEEVALLTVGVAGQGVKTLPPVRLPYSPEMAPAEPGRGRLTLERLARATGGEPRVDVGEIWRDFPRRPRIVELTPWLLAGAIVLLLAEVLERRTALVSAPWTRRAARAPERQVAEPARRRKPARRRGRRAAKDEPVAAPGPPEAAESVEEAPQPGVVDALAQARRRASRRLGR